MANYEQAAARAARRYGIDPGVFKAMIRQESGFNPNARSGAGAQGIAQFMPATARQYGVTLGDGRAADDLDGAARYLRDNLRKYGSYEKALSVYNSGRPDAYKDPRFAGGQTYNYVRSILGNANSGGGSVGSGSSSPTRVGYRTVPGVDNSATRQQLVAGYFSNSHDPNALLNLAQGLQGAQDTPSRRVAVQGPAQYGSSTGGGQVAAITARANQINAAHLPYQWGGGHQGKVLTSGKLTPLDCSGAVSAALGINPRVSGEFEKWGKPGRGRVTVYANEHHVLLEIAGHFFGTSASNPGGGAGWIKRDQISPGYLSQFTARHL